MYSPLGDEALATHKTVLLACLVDLVADMEQDPVVLHKLRIADSVVQLTDDLHTLAEMPKGGQVVTPAGTTLHYGAAIPTSEEVDHCVPGSLPT